MLEKEEKTHSHRQQKSSSFNPYAETKRRSKKINEKTFEPAVTGRNIIGISPQGDGSAYSSY